MIYLSELFNSNFIFSILIPLFILFFLIQKSISEKIMDARFPNVKLLPSGKYFILVDNGIYIYNSNFSLHKQIVKFSSSEIIKETDYNKTIITDFIDDNNNFYIICLVKVNYLYIFESQSENLYKIILIIEQDKKYYNLIPLKMEYPNFHYIISFISQPFYYQINLYHYITNKSKEKNNNTQFNYNAFGNNVENIYVSEDYISCNKILDKLFICFYRKSHKTLAAIILNDTLEKSNEKTQKISYSIELIKSSCDIKEKCFVCINDNKNGFFCYSYFINNNTFNEDIINIKVFSIKNQKLKTYYFPETNQYSLIYFYKDSKNNNIEGIVILDENFNQIHNKTTIVNPATLILTEFSFIYSITNKEYILFYDEKKK